MITPLLVEVLENRIAPAGLVTGTFKDGILTLVGDRADNVVLISGEETPGGFKITGDMDTVLKINGKTGTTLSWNIPLKGVTAQMGAGNDSVGMNNLQSLQSVSLRMGNGTNHAELNDLSVSGAVRYVGGTGDDRMDSRGQFFHAGSLTFVGGAGYNEMGFDTLNLEVEGAVTYLGGKDGDRAVLGNSAGGNVRIGGAVKIALGEGEGNAVAFGGDLVNLQEGVEIRGGNGRDVVEFSTGSTVIGGDLQIDLGNAGAEDPDYVFLGLGHTRIQGAINLTLGNGLSAPIDARMPIGNQIDLEDGSVAGGIFFQAGDGGHSFDLSSAGPVTLGPVEVKTGKGNDEILFDLNTATVGLVTLSLGEGDNRFAMSPYGFDPEESEIPLANPLEVAGITYTGGSGEDFFMIGLPGSERVVAVEQAIPPLVVPGGIKVNTGAGPGEVIISAPGYFGGGIQITGAGGDDDVVLDLAMASINGPVQIQAGAGNNEVQISGWSLRATSLGYTGGAGSDEIYLGTNELKLDGAFQLQLGEGANRCSLGAQTILKSESFTARGGNGADILSIESGVVETAGAFRVILGGGNNALQVGAGMIRVDGILTALTKAGNDTISISTHSLLTGSMTLNSGDGADSVEVTVRETAQIGGQLRLIGGDHPDSANTTLFKANALHLGGGLVASFGDGENSFTLSGYNRVNSQGPLQVSFSGTGADSAVIESSYHMSAGQVSFRAGEGSLTAQLGAPAEVELGSVHFTGGAGNDSFSILTAMGLIHGGIGVIHGGIGVSLGTGVNSFVVNPEAIATSLMVEGGIHVYSKTQSLSQEGILNRAGLAIGDQVILNHVATGAAVGIHLGDAESAVVLNSCRFPRLAVTLGDGDDRLLLAGGSRLEISGLAQIIGGAGNDSFTVEPEVTFRAGAIFDGGEGEDTLSDLGGIYRPGKPTLISVTRDLPV